MPKDSEEPNSKQLTMSAAIMSLVVQSPPFHNRVSLGFLIQDHLLSL